MRHEAARDNRPRRLLDTKGNIAEPGFARRALALYSRADIKAPAHRIKEWDYYLVNNGRFAVALDSGRQRLYGARLHLLPGL